MTSLQKFIIKVEQAHPGMFTLEDVKYSGIEKNVTLECKFHGNITKRAKTFISGPGCSKCALKMKKEKINKLMQLFEGTQCTKN